MLKQKFHLTKLSLLSFAFLATIVVLNCEVSAALAQDENGAVQDIDAGGLDEIVVTAQRRSQLLQDAPIAIRTVSGDEVLRQGLQTGAELSTFAPGLVIGNHAEQRGLVIRGAGTQGKKGSLKSAFLDVEQGEVLRGPQPVFFGQNATAGALNTRTRRPGAEWSGHAVAEVGNYGRQTLELAVGGPIS